jgi:hypothetical protein
VPAVAHSVDPLAQPEGMSMAAVTLSGCPAPTTDACLTIPATALLSKVVDLLDDVPRPERAVPHPKHIIQPMVAKHGIEAPDIRYRGSLSEGAPSDGGRYSLVLGKERYHPHAPGLLLLSGNRVGPHEKETSMADTFQDIMHNPNINGDWIWIRFTLTMTQEDGRTGFCTGEFIKDADTERLVSGMGGPTNNPASQTTIYFSDRNRFAGNGDSIGLEFFRTPGLSGLTLRSTLHSWGDAQDSRQLHLNSQPGTRGLVYHGYGDTIGHGKGQALTCLSLNDVFTIN